MTTRPPGEAPAAVSLREIDGANWLECVRLTVSEAQKGMVASNAFSLCQARYEPGWKPLAVYEKDRMVGFVMFSETAHPEWGYWIVRLMIDKAHQGRGLGRATLVEVLRLMAENPDCQEVFISHHPENKVADRLYTSLGFVRTGTVLDNGEVVRVCRALQPEPR
ncbi:MAG: GNAT family N-acetyltransferase [Bacillota bacterium]